MRGRGREMILSLSGRKSSAAHQSVTRIVLEQWLPGDTSQNSLPHAEKLQQIIREKIASRSKDNDSPWFVLCDLMQAATGRPSDRVAPSFSTSAICALLERHGVMPEKSPAREPRRHAYIHATTT